MKKSIFKYQTNPLNTHFTNFVIRTILLSVVSLYQNPQSRETTWHINILFLWEIHYMQLYVVLESLFSRNLIKFYISVIIMFRNSVLNCLVLNIAQYGNYPLNRIIGFVVFALLFVEAMAASRYIYNNRISSLITVNKIVGVEQNINNAFKNREYLIALFPIMWLTIIQTCFIVISMGATYKNWHDAFVTGFFILLIIQQITVYICIREENYTQRIIAIIVTIIVNILLIMVILYIIRIKSEYSNRIKSILLVHRINDLVTNLIFTYFLIKDTLCFDSGLRNHSTSKYDQLDLSNNK